MDSGVDRRGGSCHVGELAPGSCCRAAVGFTELWRRHRGLASAAALAALVLTVVVAAPARREQVDRTAPRSDVAHAVENTISAPALVFVPALNGPYLQNPLSFLRNTPRIDGDVVYALDRGDEANQRVRAMHAARNADVLVLPSGWSDQREATVRRGRSVAR